MPTIPNPTSYSPFFYHPGIGKLVLVNTGSNPAYNTENIATFTFNGSTWSLISTFPNGSVTNTQPSLRTSTSCAYDGTNAVFYGGKGNNGNYLNDTWLLNASSTWSASSAPNTSISTAPQQRASAYMAQQNGTTVLMFGGVDNQLTFTDASSVFTYTEAGGWTTNVVSTLPPCRINGSIASNGTSQVLFGFGSNRAGGCMNDLWSWNGTAFSQLTTSGASTTSGAPSVRHSVSIAYNGTNYIMFGGKDQGDNPLNETWQISSSGVFTKLNLPTSPSVRFGAQMAYLPGTGIVLFSGANGSSSPLLDTWVLSNSLANWVRIS